MNNIINKSFVVAILVVAVIVLTPALVAGCGSASSPTASAAAQAQSTVIQTASEAAVSDGASVSPAADSSLDQPVTVPASVPYVPSLVFPLASTMSAPALIPENALPDDSEASASGAAAAVNDDGILPAAGDSLEVGSGDAVVFGNGGPL